MATGLGKRRVVIVGGGPAGAALAMTLARGGVTAVVLEARGQAEQKIGECLPPAANPLLARLGIKDRLAADGHLASYGNRSVWGSSEAVERDFLFGINGPGWHLDRRKFEGLLESRAREEGVDWRRGHKLKKCSRQNGSWVLEVKARDGVERLKADFIVDATGRAARLARRLGARQVRYDRLVAAAALLEAPPGGGTKDSFTLVEAVASGWWYSAGLPGAGLMVVYMTDSDLVDGAAVGATGGWLALLEQTNHTWRRVREGGYCLSGGLRILPANSVRLTEVAGDGWLAAGDAATAFDPLSSYGISSAMGTGFYAAHAIADFLSGSRDALPAYKRIVDQVFARYLVSHYDHYAMERRWPDQPFWRRRHSPNK